MSGCSTVQGVIWKRGSTIFKIGDQIKWNCLKGEDTYPL